MYILRIDIGKKCLHIEALMRNVGCIGITIPSISMIAIYSQTLEKQFGFRKMLAWFVLF
jgi:hypothetical protein